MDYVHIHFKSRLTWLLAVNLPQSPRNFKIPKKTNTKNQSFGSFPNDKSKSSTICFPMISQFRMRTVLTFFLFFCKAFLNLPMSFSFLYRWWESRSRYLMRTPWNIWRKKTRVIVYRQPQRSLNRFREITRIKYSTRCLCVCTAQTHTSKSCHRKWRKKRSKVKWFTHCDDDDGGGDGGGGGGSDGISKWKNDLKLEYFMYTRSDMCARDTFSTQYALSSQCSSHLVLPSPPPLALARSLCINSKFYVICHSMAINYAMVAHIRFYNNSLEWNEKGSREKKRTSDTYHDRWLRSIDLATWKKSEEWVAEK